jgi:hypothetical protein
MGLLIGDGRTEQQVNPEEFDKKNNSLPVFCTLLFAIILEIQTKFSMLVRRIFMIAKGIIGP